MSTVIPGLLVAALVSLLGSLVIALAAATVRFAGAARLAVAEGAAVVPAGRPRFSGRDIVHRGVLVGLALLVLALVVRTVLTGHAPWSNLHEFSTAFAAAMLAAYALLERRAPIRGLAPVVALLAASLVGFALTLDGSIDPLVPALQNPLLLTLHVGAAVVAYAVSGVAFVAALSEIAQRHVPGGIGWLPSAATSRVVAHRAVLIAFPILTAAIALGSIWANLAWRSYWSNDPKELAAAATWLVYGAYLHVAARRDRWAVASPWLLVVGFAGVLFTYIGAGLFFVGEHSYAAP